MNFSGDPVTSIFNAVSQQPEGRNPSQYKCRKKCIDSALKGNEGLKRITWMTPRNTPSERHQTQKVYHYSAWGVLSMVKFVVTGSRTEVIRGQKRRHAELLFNGGRPNNSSQNVQEWLLQNKVFDNVLLNIDQKLKKERKNLYNS